MHHTHTCTHAHLCTPISKAYTDTDGSIGLEGVPSSWEYSSHLYYTQPHINPAQLSCSQSVALSPNTVKPVHAFQDAHLPKREVETDLLNIVLRLNKAKYYP